MNIGEAHDAQVLLDFVTRLKVWEYEPDVDAEDDLGGPVEGGLNESGLIGAAERLAERSRKALGAGMDAREARERLAAVGIGENLWQGQAVTDGRPLAVSVDLQPGPHAAAAEGRP